MNICPECGTELSLIAGIGSICPNESCQVSDDANLWDGRGNRKEHPSIKVAQSNEEIICEKLAMHYSGKAFISLKMFEHEIISDLEQAGWLVRNDNDPTMSLYVGKCSAYSK
jgi:hypothetical protein